MKYENLGQRYLVTLCEQLSALISENEVLQMLCSSAEVIAATPHDIEESIAANAGRIKLLTARIAQLSQHLTDVRVSDF